MKTLPGPIAVALTAYNNEESPFIKLHRMVDTYETLIKYAAVIAIQNFYDVGMDQDFPDNDNSFRTQLLLPSLGMWVSMLREALRVFSEREEDLFSSELFRFHFRRFGAKPKQQKYMTDKGASGRLLEFRNRLAHGATIPDEEAAAQVTEYEADLMTLLDKAAFLSDLPLFFVHSHASPAEFLIKSLMGANYMDAPLTLLQTTDLFPEMVGHIVVNNPQKGAYLDLHPLLLYAECRASIPVRNARRPNVMDQQPCRAHKAFYFNDFKKERTLTFLDYSQAHHCQYKEPEPLLGEFRDHFPQAERAAQGVQRFESLISELTTRFVGRKAEMEVLDNFVSTSSKRALVIIGSPGIGKSTLLAKWATNHDAIRHFIREGDASTYEPVKALENLALQVAQKFNLRWERPRQAEPGAYRQALDTLLSQAAEQATEPITLIVDGLDEAVRAAARDGGRSTQAQTILDWLPDPGLMPDQTRWILSTRPGPKAYPAWAAKFGRDRTEWLELGRLEEADVRALLFQVYSKYEVLDNPEYVEAVIEQSEGNPLYLRMLLDDLAEGRLTFGDTSALPTGVLDYFERILRFIENEGRTQEMPDVEALLQAKQETLEDLVADGILPQERMESQLELERAALEGRAGVKSIDLLALFCLAHEPLSLAEATAILEGSAADSERAFEVITPVLVKESDDCYAIFHTSFRNYFLHLDEYVETGSHRYADAIASVRQRLLSYCARWREHKSLYALRHYATHLTEAGQWKALHQLLTSGREENDWAETRRAAEGTYWGFLQDVETLWQRAADTDDVGLQIECALIKASMHSLANNLPPELLLPLITIGTPEGPWSVTAALDTVRQMTDSNRQVRALQLIAEAREMGEDLWRKMFETACSIRGERQRSDALIALAARLPETLVDEVIAQAEKTRYAEYRTKTLAALAPVIPNERKEQVLRATLAWVQETKLEWLRLDILAELAPHIPVGLLPEIQMAVRNIRYRWARARVVMALTPNLPTEFLSTALVAAHLIESEAENQHWPTQAMQESPSKQLDSTIEDALTTLQGITDEGERAEALRTLAPFLPVELLEQVLAVSRRVSDVAPRADRLVALAPHIPGGLQLEVLHEALGAAREVKDTEHRARLLTTLASYMPEGSKAQVAREALATVKQMPDGWPRSQLQSSLAPNLPVEELVNVLLGEAEENSGEGSQSTPIAVRHEREILSEALNMVWRIGDDEERHSTRAALMLLLPERSAEDALGVCLQIGDAWKRARALVDLVPRLPDDSLVEQASAEALSVIDPIPYRREELAELLQRLAPYLSETLCKQALRMTQGFANDYWRSQVLKELFPGSPDNVLGEILHGMRRSTNSEIYSDVLVELMPHMSQELLRQVLIAVQELEDNHQRAMVLGELVQHLPDDLFEEALTAAQDFDSEQHRSMILRRLSINVVATIREQCSSMSESEFASNREGLLDNLARFLPKSAHEYLAAVLEVNGKLESTLMLLELEKHLFEAELHHHEDDLRLLEEGLENVRHQLAEELKRIQAIDDDLQRAKELVPKLPYLAQDLRNRAVGNLFATIIRGIGEDEGDDADQWYDRHISWFELLRGLAPHLTDIQIRQALTLAEKSADEGNQFEILDALAPYLPEELARRVLEIISGWSWYDSGDFASVLLHDLALRLPEELLWDALMIARNIERSVDRAGTMDEIVPRLVALPHEKLAQYWRESSDDISVLRFLTRRGRRDLIMDLGALSPIIAALGGEDAMLQTICAIENVGRWWP